MPEDVGPVSGWVWCLHCERAYKRGEFRVIDGLKFCPYEGCDGDCFFDGWEWFHYRYGQFCEVPENPELPEPGRRYPTNAEYPDFGKYLG